MTFSLDVLTVHRLRKLCEPLRDMDEPMEIATTIDAEQYGETIKVPVVISRNNFADGGLKLEFTLP